jgi:hypothetical protein
MEWDANEVRNRGLFAARQALGDPVSVGVLGQSASGVVLVVFVVFAGAVIFVLLASWMVFRRGRKRQREASEPTQQNQMTT